MQITGIDHVEYCDWAAITISRVLAGVSQKEFAMAVGVHERAARYWERKAPSSLEKIEVALSQLGVVVFALPTPGVRLATKTEKIAAMG